MWTLTLLSTAGTQRLVTGFVSTYGLAFVFVYLVLETSLLLHFLPSEVVLPVAAAILVRGPLSFAAFVLVATAGATIGSLLAYTLFGTNSARLLERYGRFVHVSAADLDRWQRWFERWGETSVFWGRLLPVVRALVSVPAGAAGMDLRTFLVYSAAGAFAFNLSLTYLVYTGTRSGTPARIALDALVNLLALNLAYVRTHLAVVALEAALLAVLAAVLWRRRAWIRQHPRAAARIALSLGRACALLVGLLLLSSALAVPEQAFAAITWLWNDPLALTALGLSPAAALVVLGFLTVGGALLLGEAATRVAR